MSEFEPRKRIDRCATCRFWPARSVDWEFVAEGEAPRIYGLGGYHTDGTVSECRRRAPLAVDQDARLSGSGRWPTTKADDWCGEYEVEPDRVVNPAMRRRIAAAIKAGPGRFL